MQHLVFYSFTLLCAVLLAKLEVQTEGSDGWAAKLPTWRLDNRLTRMLLSGKPLTGYHLFLFSFVAMLAHAPIGMGFVAWTWPVEARIAAFVILLWIAEDFLWFLFNPHFGLRGFRRENIWWHAPAWWWIAPRAYWVFTPLGVFLYILSS